MSFLTQRARAAGRRPLQRKKRDGHLKLAATKKDRGINQWLHKQRQQKGKQKRKH
jgi:hypothetical protein